MRLIDADSLIEEINKVYIVEEKEDLKWAKGLHYAKTIIRNMPTIEDNAIALLKEQEKLVDVNALREKLGFAENCENCKRIPRNCQYDSHYSIMDFCERLDMAIEELTKTTS